MQKFPFFLLLILLLILPRNGRAQQRIVEEPEDTVARIGETVVLKCRVHNQRGQVIWLKGDLGLGYTRDLPFWETMSMVGSLGDGEYHLEIRNVTLADEDTYQCQLSPTGEEPDVKLSRRARLTVIVEPHGPLLLGESIGPPMAKEDMANQPIATTEGQPIRLSCQSAGGKPAAKLGWAIADDRQAQRLIGRIGNGTSVDELLHAGILHPMRVREHASIHPTRHARNQRHLAGNITEFVEFNDDTGLYTVTSHLTFSPGQEENGRWLVCAASHQAYGHEARTTSVQMDIFYAPKVRVEIDEAKSQLHEGGHVQFRCLADARPSDGLQYSWHWNGEPAKRLDVAVDGDNRSALIDALLFGDSGRKVGCNVANSIGIGHGTLELDVPYGPRFISFNQTKTVDRGSEVTFQCEVIGNPEPIVRWYHGRQLETPVFEGKNLTIRNVQDWEEGQYACRAEVDGFAPATLHHMLYLKGPPKVRLGDYVLTDRGSTMTLTCEIQSRALPLRVHWFHNGHRVDIAEHHPDGGADAEDHQQRRRYEIHDEKVGRHELISRLTIHQFGPHDFGRWNCSAKNDYGLVWDQRDIELLGLFERIVRYAQGMPLELQICLVAMGLLLLLLPLLLCCLCRRWCCPRGHSKLSNHSSDPRGDFSVKCEELDGLTSSHSCSTPPYPHQQQHQQQQYYTMTTADGGQQQQQAIAAVGDYLCAPPQFNPDMDQSMLYGGGGAFGGVPPQQFNEYFVANGPATLGLNAGGGSSTFGGADSFGIVGNLQQTQMNPYDSFGLARVHQYQPQPQQQQYYGYTGGPSSPLEPVTEVCTPESQEEDYSGQQAPNEQQRPPIERSISRISTHV